eukprot:152755_1
MAAVAAESSDEPNAPHAPDLEQCVTEKMKGMKLPAKMTMCLTYQILQRPREKWSKGKEGTAPVSGTKIIVDQMAIAKFGTQIIVKNGKVVEQTYTSTEPSDVRRDKKIGYLWKNKDGTKVSISLLPRSLNDYWKSDDPKYSIFIKRERSTSTKEDPKWKTIKTLPKPPSASGSASSAYSSYYNNLDYRSLFDEPAPPMHYENGLQLAHVHGGQDGEYYNGLLVGGVVGGGSIVVLFVIFCIGLAFGMIICFGYQQKKALEERKKEDWRQDDV